MALAFPPHAIQAILDIADKINSNNNSNNNGKMVKIGDDYNPPQYGLEQSFTSTRNANADLFKSLLEQPVINIDKLRALSWAGVPPEYRPLVWKLLLNYLPLEKKLHNKILYDKRNQYLQLVNKFYHAEMSSEDKALLNQVRLDVPRTIPRGFSNTPLFKSTILHKVLERILFVWSQTNPLISYFQGLNDIPAQFLLVFLSQYIDPKGSIGDLTIDLLDKIEADTFWCLSLLMNNLKNRFINFHDGINRMAMKLEKLVKLKEGKLCDHLQTEGCDFILFSLRWMICLLSREFDYSLCTRLWDSYIAHGPNFGYFHIYVCAALITAKEWVPSLLKKEFSDLIVFLQRLPTDSWNIHHIDYLLVGAYQIFLLEVQSAVKDSTNNIFQFLQSNILPDMISQGSLSSDNQKDGADYHPLIQQPPPQQQLSNNNNNNNSILLEGHMKNIYQMFLKQQSNSNNINNNNVKIINNYQTKNHNNCNINNNNQNNINSTCTAFSTKLNLNNQNDQPLDSMGGVFSITEEMKNKILEFLPSSVINFSQFTPETADEELVKQITFHLMVIIGVLLFIGIILLVIIICTSLTILSLEYMGSMNSF